MRPQPNAAIEGLPARRAARALLSSVIEREQPLDATLESEVAFLRLPPRDRALARAIVAMALRRRGTIAAILASLMERPPRHAGALPRILEVGLAQLLFMAVPDHAAVSLAMAEINADKDANHFRGLANAVLRRAARERQALLAAHDEPALDTPEWLWQRWLANYGEATAAGIAAAHRLEPSLDVSVKRDPEHWAERLGGSVLPTGGVRALATGEISALPGYEEGAWWIQDAAAALPAKLLGDVAGKTVVDLCAAPGGKTAALAAAGAHVTAVDISSRRLERLSANLKRLSLAAEVIAADALEWRPPEPVDAVLLDAPCTTTGTIRRHPDVAWLKRPADVATLSALQARMLDHAVSLLKPGGTLVYCTCSLEPEEGENHLAPLLARQPVVLDAIAAAEVGGVSEVVTATGTVRTLPTHLPGAEPRLSGLDGFFIMRLKRRSEG
jgi:16S rRNA (cytosine967-C5)-methyltransferase